MLYLSNIKKGSAYFIEKMNKSWIWIPCYIAYLWFISMNLKMHQIDHDKGCSLLTKPGVSHVLFSEAERKGILLYCLKLPVETIDILANYFCIINWKKKGKVCKFLKN